MSTLALIPSSGVSVSDSVVFNPSSLIRVLVFVPVLGNFIWNAETVVATALCHLQPFGQGLFLVAGFPFMTGFSRLVCPVTFRLKGVATSLF